MSESITHYLEGNVVSPANWASMIWRYSFATGKDRIGISMDKLLFVNDPARRIISRGESNGNNLPGGCGDRSLWKAGNSALPC